MTYTTGGITVEMALGMVTGDASIGIDTLRSIEIVQGTNFDDTYDATGFGNGGHLDPALYNVGNGGTYNQFEGIGGDERSPETAARRSAISTRRLRSRSTWRLASDAGTAAGTSPRSEPTRSTAG